MGYLTDELDGETAPITQKRGRTYFAHGAVRLLDAGDSSVSARVQGSQVYRVNLAVADGFIDYSCTCPFFTSDFNACKHVWATAMAAELRGCLKKILDSDDHRSARSPSDQPAGMAARRTRSAKVQAPSWKQQLQTLRHALTPAPSPFNDRPAPERQLFYLIDADYTLSRQKLTLEVARRERKNNGEWGKLKSQRLYSRELDALTDPADRRITAMLFGARQDLGYSYSSYYDSAPSLFAVPENLWDLALPLMCQTGRCLLRSPKLDDATPLVWDEGPAWELCLTVERETDSARYRLAGSLRRGEEVLDLAQPVLLLAGGLVFYNNRITRLNDHGAFAWVSVLRAPTALSFAVEDAEVFLDELVSIPNRPRLELPAELQFETVAGAPQPRLLLKPGKHNNWSSERLTAELSFDYDGSVVPHQHRGGGFYQKERRRLVTRDLSAEDRALARLKQLGFRKGWEYDRADLQLAPDQLARVVRVLSGESWHIEAQGSLYRTAGALTMQVNSSVDWFGVDGAAEFGDSRVGLPRLLRAIKQGEQTVRLDDGSLGIIPE
jgi:hypothetical protein